MRNRIIYILVVCCLACFSTSCHRTNGKTEDRVDSLNQRAYAYRYVNVDTVSRLAQQVLSLRRGYDDQALLNLAYVAYQQMDYERVDTLLTSVRAHSYNQVSLLCADVMEMKITQRIGEGLRFFQARRSAEKRIRRIEGERAELHDRDARMYRYALSEMHIITSTYYYYQGVDSLAISEIESVRDMDLVHTDLAQWVYYNYMMGSGGLAQEANDKQRMLTEFDYLTTVYLIARRSEYLYFEANALQSLATMMQSYESVLQQERPDAYAMLEAQHMSWDEDDLSLALANHAVSLFATYGDLFQHACALRTRGEIYFNRGAYEQALVNYAEALHDVNEHHVRYYHSTDTLSMDGTDTEAQQVERDWLTDATIYTVPEWIADIRKQISMAYSALGDKAASDFNRNAYLDILENANQNVEYEDRMTQLNDQTQALGRRIVAVCILLVLMAMLFLGYRRYLKRQADRSRRHLQQVQSGDWHSETYETMQEEEEELEEQIAMVDARLAANKEKNIENRARVSLVHAVVPYLDRIRGEVIRMNRTGKSEPARCAYILELTEEIEHHNAVLTEWIKMQQGELRLRITTCSVARLFDVVRSGHYSFEQKKITLLVEDTDLKVKADESLTLFMINTLADNARKFTPEGGKVHISAVSGETYVEIQVEDTGQGLSEEDVDTLNHSKVYDPSAIGGRQSEGKGFGFGLMNCRGIIEKYKKQSALFACCTFGVQSTLGKGSRFFFRLPRVLGLLLAFSVSLSLFADPQELYDSVYICNVNGSYQQAVQVGEQALQEIDSRLLLVDSLASSEDNEVTWYNAGEDMDYRLIMGLRNEIALAALALNDWPLYRYNNAMYTRLQKLTNQDRSLPEYCRKLEDAHRNGALLLAFIVLLSVVILTLVYRLLILRLKNVGKDYEQQIIESLRAAEERKRNELDARGDILQQRRYEENRLHVQNQVLDNCLSTIKHESMYYPSRIRQLAEHMDDSQLPQLSEWVDYYHNIYTLLCQQADDQVGQPGFKRRTLRVADLTEQVRRVAETLHLTLHVAPLGDVASDSAAGDGLMLDVLFRQLLTFMARQTSELTLRVTAGATDVLFTFADRTNVLSDDELHQLFYPAADRLGMLVAKQIIREHDAGCGNPGLRLTAQREDEGYSISFTLRKQ